MTRQGDKRASYGRLRTGKSEGLGVWGWRREAANRGGVEGARNKSEAAACDWVTSSEPSPRRSIAERTPPIDRTRRRPYLSLLGASSALQRFVDGLSDARFVMPCSCCALCSSCQPSCTSDESRAAQWLHRSLSCRDRSQTFPYAVHAALAPIRRSPLDFQKQINAHYQQATAD